MTRWLQSWVDSAGKGSLAERFARVTAWLATAVLLLTALASWALATWQNQMAERALLQKEADYSAALVGTTVTGIVVGIDEMAESTLLASALTDSAGKENYLHPYLSSVRHVNSVPVSILFTDFIGNELASNDYTGFVKEHREWLARHLAEGKESAIIVRDAQGPAILAIRLIRPPRTGQPEGALLYRFSLRDVLYESSVQLSWDSQVAGMTSPPLEHFSARVEAPPPLDRLALRVSLAPRPASLAISAAQIGLILTLALVMAVLVYFLGHRVARSLTRQLRRLEEFSSEVVLFGFGSARAATEGADEVASLSRSINHMLDSLHEQHQHLQRESERRNQLLARYRLLIESTNAISWEASWPEGGYSYVSPQAERLFGYAISAWHAPDFWRARVHVEDLDRALQARDAALEGVSEYSCEYRFRNQVGDYLWVEEIGSAVAGDRSMPAGLRGILIDVGQRKAAEAEIQHLAFYDPLTGLPNRRMLLDRLHRLVDANASGGEIGAVVFIDLDNFKTLNDTFGHDMGDLLLKEAAARLSSAVRKNDLVARLGGDEFVVLLAGGREPPEAFRCHIETIAEKILQTMDKPYQLRGREHLSTASLGIYVFNTHEDSVTDMLKRADLAMYRTKQAGRNGVSFFESGMQTVISHRAELESSLRRALRNHEFELHFQPQVTDQAKLLGFEVLLRWKHPERGLIRPQDFIGLAEETGMIVPIGLWALRTACQQLAAWANDPVTAGLTLSVNVSARQFRDDQFVDQVLATVRETGVNPRRLRLELTESLLVDDVNAVIYKMKTLRASGVGFSLDDFGTGYSSLSYLRQLPLDELKIDHSFFRNVLTEETDAAIVRTIVVLAHSLKLHLIAEGVEDERQRDFLAKHGCHAFQGFLFGASLPQSELDDYLRERLRAGAVRA